MPGLKAKDYLMYPWSIRGPFEGVDEHGNQHYEIRIRELPDFLVAGTSVSEALYELKPALLAFLESYTADGEVPPVPDGPPASYSAYRVRRPLAGAVRHPTTEATASPGLRPDALVTH
jgi:predicted RNase H-like HicB family nuclease